MSHKNKIQDFHQDFHIQEEFLQRLFEYRTSLANTTTREAGHDDSFGPLVVETATGFESRSGGMPAVGVVQTECYKLSKGIECAWRSMVLCTI